MSRHFFILSLLILSAIGLQACQDKTTIDSTVIIHNDMVPHAQLGDNVIPQSYKLDMRINPDADTMSGTSEIMVDIIQPTTKIWLHGKNMTVTGAEAIIGKKSYPLTFTELSHDEAPSGIAHLTSEKPLPAGQAILKLPYVTPYNLSLNSAYKVVRGEDAYIVTQFEPLGAREAFPGFDEPRFKVPFTISITAPKDDVVYANTPTVNLAEVQFDQSDVTWLRHDFQTSRPLPSYLIAFGVGPYDVVDYEPLPPTKVRPRSIELRGLTARGSGDEIVYGLENTAGIMEAIENYFGIPYPYEKLDLIAAPEYAFGAMENPGAIVYREYLMLLNEESALRQKRAYASVHSHEIAHQWFGNLVTPVWWEDIWLNEAFATWMGNKGINIWNPDGNFDRNTLKSALGAMSIDSLSSTRKVREPLLRSESVMDQFDGITYRKGGGVLSMFESYLGEGRFQDGVRLHMGRYADDVATADNFFQSIADGAKDPTVVDAMKSFVDQPGLPLVEASFVCDIKDDGEPSVTRYSLAQSRYAPLGSKTKQGQIWQIPVCARFIYADGSAQKHCVLLKDKNLTPIKKGPTSFERTDGQCPLAMAPNENGSGYYRFSLDTKGWSALLNNLDQLSTREVLTVQDSLEAAFRAGKVEASVYLQGMKIFARHIEYDVASGAGGLIGWMREHLPKETRPKQAALIRDMMEERYNRIKDSDTVEGNLLTPTLLSNLLFRVEDTALRAEFSAKGAAYLGLDGTPDKTVVAQNQLSQALRMVMKTQPEAAYQPLLTMVSQGSSFEKGAAVVALGSTDDAATVVRLRELALTDKAAMTGRQASALIGTLTGSEKFGDETWDWLKTNFDAFVTERVADVRKPGMPGYASGCSEAKRNEVEAFFMSKAALIPGYERSLAQTLERIELCSAFKAATLDNIQEALLAQ